MPTCSAINCSYKHCRHKTPGISVHRFPFSRPLILKMWIKNVRKADWSPSRWSVLCSSHFEAECFDRSGLILKLKPDAVPTLFDFPKHLQKEEKKHRKKRLNAQQKEKECKTERVTSVPDIIHLRSIANAEQLEDTCGEQLSEAYTEFASPDSNQEVVEQWKGAKLLPEGQINNMRNEGTEEIFPYITNVHSTATAGQLEDICNEQFKEMNTKRESEKANHKLKRKVMKRSASLEKQIMQPCVGQEKAKEMIVAPINNQVCSIGNTNRLEYVHNKQFNTTPATLDTNQEIKGKLVKDKPLLLNMQHSVSPEETVEAVAVPGINQGRDKRNVVQLEGLCYEELNQTSTELLSQNTCQEKKTEEATPLPNATKCRTVNNCNS